MRTLVWIMLLTALCPAARGQQISVTSPGGGHIASANKKVISITDAKSQKLLIRIAAHKADISGLAYSPDGKMLASCDNEGAVNVFDAATGKQLWTSKALKGATGLEFSKGGKTLTVKAPGGPTKFISGTGKKTQ